jgi:hypothetical protein
MDCRLISNSLVSLGIEFDGGRFAAVDFLAQAKNRSIVVAKASRSIKSNLEF